MTLACNTQNGKCTKPKAEEVPKRDLVHEPKAEQCTTPKQKSVQRVHAPKAERVQHPKQKCVQRVTIPKTEQCTTYTKTGLGYSNTRTKSGTCTTPKKRSVSNVYQNGIWI